MLHPQLPLTRICTWYENAFDLVGSTVFSLSTWVEVGREGMDAKVKALGMYRGVMRPYPHPRSAEAIEGFAAYRGCQAGCSYAEAFEVVLRRY